VRARPSQWVIRVTFVDGDSRYHGGFMSEPEWVRTRGSAGRYDSEADALHHAYELKHRHNNRSDVWPRRRIDEVAVEEIRNPRMG
jgi:hypothetical protein